VPQLLVESGETSVLGIGWLEIGVILLVAFLVLGPGKSIDMARTVGKTIRDLRQTFTDLTTAVELDKEETLRSSTAVPSHDPEEHPKSRDLQ
jgi:Sec-independent protein translocase protein TatA